jgi:hypothetical protein
MTYFSEPSPMMIKRTMRGFRLAAILFQDGGKVNNEGLLLRGNKIELSENTFRFHLKVLLEKHEGLFLIK